MSRSTGPTRHRPVASAQPPRAVVRAGGRCGWDDRVMAEDFRVVAAAGSLRATGAHFPHRWTEEGVVVETSFTGAHLLHLSVAACVLNDLYREAESRDVPLHGVRVEASGGFDPDTWTSTGVSYAVALDSPAPAADQDALLAAVADIAEIPRALRAGMPVTRRSDDHGRG